MACKQPRAADGPECSNVLGDLSDHMPRDPITGAGDVVPRVSSRCVGHPQGDREALVRTWAVALNFFDVIQMMGAMPGRVAGRNILHAAGGLGSDFAGLVVEGYCPGSGLVAGDEIFGIAEGSLQTYISSSKWLASLVPRGLDFATAAALPTVALTLSAVTGFAKVTCGDLVLVHAGTGGTGAAGFATFRRCGALVATSASSAKKQCFLRVKCGARSVASSRDGQAFMWDIMADLPPRCSGPTVIVNSLTHDDFVARGCAVLAAGGRFLELGKLRAWSAKVAATFRRDVSYSTLLLDGRIAGAASTLTCELRAIAQAAHECQLKPPPLTSFSFPDQVVQAFKVLQGATHLGKVVLCFPAGGHLGGQLVRHSGGAVEPSDVRAAIEDNVGWAGRRPICAAASLVPAFCAFGSDLVCLQSRKQSARCLVQKSVMPSGETGKVDMKPLPVDKGAAGNETQESLRLDLSAVGTLTEGQLCAAGPRLMASQTDDNFACAPEGQLCRPRLRI
ncbi:unnamed protein product [Polarella glacialis]|uniref:Enoyl reductase (ER) domain-containing protein n=1 Tax=Polarella glacialis TaxID=89957 RepID=A0A813JKT6_POLGL|nr:unnamed protein product [Polarella glacialis]